jgi:hypothetical protein
MFLNHACISSSASIVVIFSFSYVMTGKIIEYCQESTVFNLTAARAKGNDTAFSPGDDAFFNVTETNYCQIPPFIDNMTQQDMINTSWSPINRCANAHSISSHAQS